jgi:hypothetical protein
MSDIFVIKSVDGGVVYHSSDDGLKNPPYGNEVARSELASKILTPLSRLPVSWAVVHREVLKGIDLDRDVSIVEGEVVINSSGNLRRELAKKADRLTKSLILSGYECPFPGEVQDDGTGYSVGDKVSLSGGEFSSPARFIVLAVGGSGEVFGIQVIDRGDYSVIPSNPAATTGGKGSGLTIDVFQNSDRWGTALGGEIYSFSTEAQANLLNASFNKDNIRYPIYFPNTDNTAFTEVSDSDGIAKLYDCAFREKASTLTAGAMVKKSISEAADDDTAQLISDSDPRSEWKKWKKR